MQILKLHLSHCFKMHIEISTDNLARCQITALHIIKHPKLPRDTDKVYCTLVYFFELYISFTFILSQRKTFLLFHYALMYAMSKVNNYFHYMCLCLFLFFWVWCKCMCECNTRHGETAMHIHDTLTQNLTEGQSAERNLHKDMMILQVS